MKSSTLREPRAIRLVLKALVPKLQNESLLVYGQSECSPYLFSR